SLMAFSVQGRDVSISKGRIEGYRNFMNKIWNASRFAIQALPENFSPQQHPQPRTLADTWIQNQLHETVQKSRKALDQFRFNEYAECLYQFVWHEFCDWYLELAKVHLYGEDENLKNSCAQNLIYVLEEILVLMHPVCPFITELLWKTIPGNKDLPSVMLRSYPKSENIPSADPKTLLEMQGLQELITGIRTIRSENTIPPKTKLKLILGSIQTELKASDLEKHRNYLTQLANLEEISFEGKAPDNNSAIFRGDYFQAWVPLEGLIDNASEITRLEKKIEKIQKDIAFLSGKLCNEKYIKNAPLHLVERDQKKLKKSQEDLAKVEKSIQKLQS
ncbi:MAG: class I tRNA ligase family protein, partial [Bdellovibrionales bacterium]|nr:class I tRNA ligase family protein [Bdellovibrionales bacterium]